MVNEKLYHQTIDKLQKTWHSNEELVTRRHAFDTGIRSSQVAALVLLLIEMGVIKPEGK